MELKEKQEFIENNRRYLDKYMRFCLASLPSVKVPKLVIDLSKESYTNHEIIHIGIGELNVDTEEELMMHTLFLIDHEVQHNLSTTDKAWNWGITEGTHLAIQLYADHIGKSRRFAKEEDYDRFLDELKSGGYKISRRGIEHFVHYIVNSLEDGRIERIRMQKRPGFKSFVVACRGKDWKEEPVSTKMLDEMTKSPYVHLLVVLNQVLTLSTMGIYQKDFVLAADKEPEIHRMLDELIPYIRSAVSRATCRRCMMDGLEIVKKLAVPIIEASKTIDIESILGELIAEIIDGQEFSADSRTEETGDEGGEGIPIPIFGESDALSEGGDDGQEGPGGSGGEETKEGENSGNGGGSEGEAGEDGEDGKGSGSSGKGSEKDPGQEGKGSSDGKPDKDGKDDIVDSKPGKPSGKPSGKGGNGKSGGNGGNNGPSEGDISQAIKDALKDIQSDVNIAIKGGAYSNADTPEIAVKGEGMDKLPDLGPVSEVYDYNVTFEEREREYACDEIVDAELHGKITGLKRKIERIFQNMERPQIKGLHSGHLDPTQLYKLAENSIDCFDKKAKTEKFDGCCYLLADASGSMGGGVGSKRYYCCNALSVIEGAFEKVMPLKIAAFHTRGNSYVIHNVIKNWSESIPRNGSYNYLCHDDSWGGNKDGYSIRVATREILAQPGKKKLLIILSDGLPSDYNKGYNEGIQDVQNAVTEARKSGIEVVSIYFGELDKETVANFEEMYKFNTIAVEPEQIEDSLVSILKRFTFKK